MSSWAPTTTAIVRGLINDLSATPVYSDARIQQAVIIGGLISSQEFPFVVDYTFDVEGSGISPDPVATQDDAAVALFTLKAACILDTNKYQTAVGDGIRVKDGDSEVDTTAAFKGYTDLLKLGPCAGYQFLLKKSSLLLSMGGGRAIVSPLSHPDVNITPYGARSFFDYIGLGVGGYGDRL